MYAELIRDRGGEENRRQWWMEGNARSKNGWLAGLVPSLLLVIAHSGEQSRHQNRTLGGG